MENNRKGRDNVTANYSAATHSATNQTLTWTFYTPSFPQKQAIFLEQFSNRPDPCFLKLTAELCFVL